MNNFMRHFIVKLLCDEMECKDISEIAGFAFRKSKPFGYVYGDMVLAKAEWDEESFPNALMVSYSSSQELRLYVSAEPITNRRNGFFTNTIVNPPYRVYPYSRETNSWGAYTEVAEGGEAAAVSGYNVWSNHDIINTSNNSVDLVGAEPEPFYLGVENYPTAFLYNSGTISFQSNSCTDNPSNISAAYVKWDTAKYSNSPAVPWLRIDKLAITAVTMNSDAIPAYTDYWFYECSNLGSASLAEGLRQIGQYMFIRTKLAPINIPSTVEEIGTYAYAKLLPYVNLQTIYRKSINIPDSVVKIGSRAFQEANLDHYTIVTIGAGCEEIGNYAFANNPDIKNVTIGASVKRIGSLAFWECGSSRAGIGSTQDAWCNVIFKNTSGWWVSKSETATEGVAVDVSDPKAAGKLIAAYSNGNYDWEQPTVDGQYHNYYWNRST